MKILLITPLFPWKSTTSRSKMTHAVKDLIQPWPEMGAEVNVIKPFAFYSHWKEFRNLKSVKSIIEGISVWVVPILKIPRTKMYWYKNVQKMIIRESSPTDVLLAHYYVGLEALFGIRNQLKENKIIFGVHMTDVRKIESRLHLLDLVDAYAFRSLPVMNKFCDLLKRHRIAHNKPFFITNSGLSKEIFAVAKDGIVERIKGRRFRILTVARLLKLKSIDIVLRALSTVEPSLDWSYTIIGDGPEKGHLELLAKKSGISDRVYFAGNKSHAECLNAMTEHDVFIMPSAPETLGLVFLEAMARGMLVIGAKGWGIDGIIQNNINGFLVNRDSFEIKLCLEELNKQDIGNIITQSRITISEMTDENVSRRYLNFILSVIDLSAGL